MSAEAELAALLKAPQAGLRLVHLHLGRLDNPHACDRKILRTILRELGKKSDSWRLFDIANGDLLMLYRSLKYSAVEAACQEIAGLLVEARLGGSNPYPDGSMPPGPLYHIFDLSSNASNVLRYLEAMQSPPSQH